MTWFGWLTKPALQVTYLDRVTMVGEIFSALALGFILLLFVEYLYRGYRRWKGYL